MFQTARRAFGAALPTKCIFLFYRANILSVPCKYFTIKLKYVIFYA